MQDWSLKFCHKIEYNYNYLLWIWVNNPPDEEAKAEVQVSDDKEKRVVSKKVTEYSVTWGTIPQRCNARLKFKILPQDWI